MDWNFATTLIGSLPFTDKAASVDTILGGCVDCPPWPQLPRNGSKESMYAQTGVRLPGLDLESEKLVVDLGCYDPTEIYMAILSEDVSYFEHPKDYYEGMYELLSRDLSSFKAVKGQVTGPISEGFQIFDQDGRPVIYDESYGEIVRKTVNMMAKWQAATLKNLNPNVIMFFDEPSFSMLGTPFASVSDEQALTYMTEAMEGVDCFKGIHCCGNTNWSLVMSMPIDILNFDAYMYGDNLVIYSDDLRRYVDRGGAIAWGIIPNSDEAICSETVGSLVERMESLFSKLSSKGIDVSKVARQSLLTPQCGLSGTSPENVPKALELLKGVSEEMRKRYCL